MLLRKAARDNFPQGRARGGQQLGQAAPLHVGSSQPDILVFLLRTRGCQAGHVAVCHVDIVTMLHVDIVTVCHVDIVKVV